MNAETEKCVEKEIKRKVSQSPDSIVQMYSHWLFDESDGNPPRELREFDPVFFDRLRRECNQGKQLKRGTDDYRRYESLIKEFNSEYRRYWEGCHASIPQ